MKALVTGGSGVIGSHVVRGLVGHGVDVLAVSRAGNPELLADLAGQFQSVAADVGDAARMRTVLDDGRFDVVVHLAASLPALADADPVGAAQINVLASTALFDAAHDAGVARFVFASSKAAYGPMPEGVAVSEAFPARPDSCYGASKLAAELLIAAQAARPGAPQATSLRFATIYGPGKASRHAGAALLSSLIEDALAGVPVRIERGGDQVDDMIWVGDAAAGIVAAALHPGELSPLYNISTGVGTSLREFAAGVVAAVPGAQIEVGGGLDYMGPGFVYGVMDPALAAAELGFAADADPQSGARRFAAALHRLSA